MSIYIGGWVEIHSGNRFDGWQAVIKIDWILRVNYDMFGCIFGVMNHTGLSAPPLRGLPDNLSLEGLLYDENHNDSGGTLYQSWLTWAEIKALDLDEVGVDRRAHQYRRGENGELIYMNSKGMTAGTPEVVEVGMTWDGKDGVIHKIQSISRREIFEMSADWQILFEMLRQLEKKYSDDKIRLVVWF